MKDEQLFDELIMLADRLEVEIVKDKGDFSGGYCRVREDRRIVLNQHNLLPTQMRILARNLLQFDLSNMYILPAVREFLETVAEEEDMELMGKEESSPVAEDG